MTLYKFLYENDGRIVSDHGDHTWVLGEWYSVEGPIKVCSNGFHASTQPLDALRYVSGDVVGVVEVDGDSDNRADKVCHRRMRVAQAYRWSKFDSVALAVYAAGLVINIFDVRFPEDDRPRKAIEASKAWLDNPTPDAADAAHTAADAAHTAHTAANAHTADAAHSAAYAAYAAYAAADAYTAHTAHTAYTDAYSAVHAAYAAADAYTDADAHTVEQKINAWMINRIQTLEPITQKVS